jgi:signal transduction histidine kinase
VISARHRRRLNSALHELRRPLQVMALLDGDGDPGAGDEAERARRGLLELARSALRDLDRELNGGGGGAPSVRREVSCRELMEASLERWRPAAEAAGGFRVFWDAGPAPVICDPVRLSQALDNLIANALDHGGPPLVVTGANVAGRLRITVANGEGRAPGAGAEDPRRGHGVGIVSRVVAEHRGRFALCRTGSGCVAALEVPLNDRGLARAA